MSVRRSHGKSRGRNNRSERFFHCERKRAYPTWDEAERQASKLTEGSGELIMAYRCKFCGLWHNGHADTSHHRVSWAVIERDRWKKLATPTL